MRQSDFFYLLSKKVLYGVKANGQHLSFNIFLVDLTSEIQQKQTE